MSNIVNLEERRKARAEKAAQEAALAEQAKAKSHNTRIDKRGDYYSVTFKSYQKYYKYPTQEDAQ